MYSKLAAIKHLRESLAELIKFSRIGNPCKDDCHCTMCNAEHAMSCTSGFDNPPKRDDIPEPEKEEILYDPEFSLIELQEDYASLQEANSKLSLELNHVTKQWDLAQKTIAHIVSTIDLVRR